MNISQSTLSQQIKQLEDELDVLLFNRIGKRIILTEAGEMFGDYALQSIDKANQGLLLLKDLNNPNMGRITIGVIYSMRLPFARALIQFAKLPQYQDSSGFWYHKKIFSKNLICIILTLCWPFMKGSNILILNTKHF